MCLMLSEYATWVYSPRNRYSPTTSPESSNLLSAT